MSTEQEEKLLFKHPAYFIAFGCGSGFSRYAPGTVSTLWAWAFFLVFDTLFTFNFWIFLLLISFALGIWASSYTTKKLNKNDPSEIVIDEIVSFWVILVLLPSTSDPMGEVILSGFPEWLLHSDLSLFS